MMDSSTGICSISRWEGGTDGISSNDLVKCVESVEIFGELTEETLTYPFGAEVTAVVEMPIA